jgi:beta-galactosidase GanA
MLLVAAVAVAAAVFIHDAVANTTAVLTGDTWNLTATTGVANEYHEYIIDHGLTLGDCLDKSKQRPYYTSTVDKVTVWIGYGCSRAH